MSYNYQENIPAPVSDMKMQEIFTSVMAQVYLWMALGLVVTAVTTYITVSSPFLLGLIFGSRFVFWGLVVQPTRFAG